MRECNRCGAEIRGKSSLCPSCKSERADERRFNKERRRDERIEREARKVCKFCGVKTRGRLRICPDCRRERKRKVYYSNEKPENYTIKKRDSFIHREFNTPYTRTISRGESRIALYISTIFALAIEIMAIFAFIRGLFLKDVSSVIPFIILIIYSILLVALLKKIFKRDY